MPIVSYPGTEGSFSHKAALALFPKGTLMAYVDWEDVAKAVEKGQSDYGVFPISNTLAGDVPQTLKLLERYPMHIVAEHSEPIHHCLMAVNGATLDTINIVHSHPHALKQCRIFLSERPCWHEQPSQSTALSAQYVAMQKDTSLAAIAPSEAAKAYGLKVLAYDIQDSKANYTRFVVVVKGE